MNQSNILSKKHSKLKNLLYVLDTFPKISETFILNEICHLLNLGYEIKIISLNKPNEENHNANFYNFNLANRVKYFSKKEIEAATGEIRNYISDCQVIHSHFAHDAALVAGRLAKKLGLPFSVTVHAYEIFREGCFDFARVQEICNEASLIFTPSMYNKKFISNLIEVDSSKIKIVRATIDHVKFQHFLTDTDKKSSFQLAYCGRLIEKKGVDFLLKAVALLRQKRQDFHLKIIGTGHLEYKLKNLTNDLEANSYVEFLGEKTNEEFQKELIKTDIFVSPCIIDHNGDRDVCPLTIQEAMAMHVPVISTSIASIPELVQHDISGILVPEKDTNTLTDAIDALLNSKEKRIKLAINARAIIENEFNNTIQTQKLLKDWEEII